MINFCQKALAISAIFLFHTVYSQVGISANPNFRPDPGYTLHVDGELNVRGKFKTTSDPDHGMENGNNGQVLQM